MSKYFLNTFQALEFFLPSVQGIIKIIIIIIGMSSTVGSDCSFQLQHKYRNKLNITLTLTVLDTTCMWDGSCSRRPQRLLFPWIQ
jgi:hypothetical protein